MIFARDEIIDPYANYNGSLGMANPFHVNFMYHTFVEINNGYIIYVNKEGPRCVFWRPL